MRSWIRKALATNGVGLYGRTLLNATESATVGDFAVGLINYAGFSTGVLEVAGAGLTPFATTALYLAGLNCEDPITGKPCL